MPSQIYLFFIGYELKEGELEEVATVSGILTHFEQCSITDKPGSWFLLIKCLKNTCGRVTF